MKHQYQTPDLFLIPIAENDLLTLSNAGSTEGLELDWSSKITD